MTPIPHRRIRDNQYEFPSHWDVSLDARELVQQILTPNPQERPSLHDIVDHAFFTSGIVSGFIPISAREMPPDFRHISHFVSQANLSRLRQACQLDGGDATAPEDNKPPAPSASSASSLAQPEREFQKAVRPDSPISALLSSACQPLKVAPGGIIGTARGEPTLLRKLQATKKEAATAKLLAKTLKAYSRLQGISEEGGQGEEVRMMKELQSEKARIVAQMIPAQLRVPPPRSTTESPFENAENVTPAQGERRVRVRTKEILGESTPT